MGHDKTAIAGMALGALALAALVATLCAFAARQPQETAATSAQQVSQVYAEKLEVSGTDALRSCGVDADELASEAARWSDDEGLGLASLSAVSCRETADGAVIGLLADDGRQVTCVWTRGALAPFGFTLSEPKASPYSEAGGAPPQAAPGVLPDAASAGLPDALTGFLSSKGIEADGHQAKVDGDSVSADGTVTSFVAELPGGIRVEVDYHGDTGRYGMALLP